MATTKDYKEYVLEQLSILDKITCHPMMGEYLLYYQEKLFGGIYDNRVLIKKTEVNKKFNLQEEIPYKGAKPMFFLENLDDQDLIRDVIITTCESLNEKK